MGALYPLIKATCRTSRFQNRKQLSRQTIKSDVFASRSAERTDNESIFFYFFSFTVEKRKLGQKISQVMQEAESMETED